MGSIHSVCTVLQYQCVETFSSSVILTIVNINHVLEEPPVKQMV